MSDECEQWRLDEALIDGGFCGCEFPRLWPPRRYDGAPPTLADVQRELFETAAAQS